MQIDGFVEAFGKVGEVVEVARVGVGTGVGENGLGEGELVAEIKDDEIGDKKRKDKKNEEMARLAVIEDQVEGENQAQESKGDADGELGLDHDSAQNQVKK